MTKWARIESGRVAESTDIDPEGRFHPSIEWIAFDGRKNVTVGSWERGHDENGEPTLVERPPISLADLAIQKLAEIETARDAAINEGFTHTFGDTDDIVQTRQRDRENLTGLAVSAQRHADETFYFRAKSNATFELTAEEMLALADAAQAHVSQQYSKSWQLKAAIDAALKAEDRAAVEAVEW